MTEIANRVTIEVVIILILISTNVKTLLMTDFQRNQQMIDRINELNNNLNKRMTVFQMIHKTVSHKSMI